MEMTKVYYGLKSNLDGDSAPEAAKKIDECCLLIPQAQEQAFYCLRCSTNMYERGFQDEGDDEGESAFVHADVCVYVCAAYKKVLTCFDGVIINIVNIFF